MVDRAKVFDVLRKLAPGIWNTPGTIEEMNEVLDIYDGRATPDAPTMAERPGIPHEASPAALALIKRFEGCARLRPDGLIESYPDPATGGAPWTIGWGATTDEVGRSIGRGEVWSQARADQRLEQHVREFEEYVVDALGDAQAGTSQPQFDALVSFAYNVGPENLRRSTLLRKHKAGDFAGAANEFKRWNRAAGRVLRGLTRRRAAEADLYRSGM